MAERKCPWCDGAWDDDRWSHDCGISDDVIRRLIMRCVTVVDPGQVLVVRMPVSLPEERMAMLERAAENLHDSMGVKIVFVGGEEFAVMAPEDQERIVPIPLEAKRRP